MPQFLQSQAADLTPYLAGDAAKDYPNLAAIPTPAWKNAGSAYQGKLYLVPLHRYLPGQMFVKNTDCVGSRAGQRLRPQERGRLQTRAAGADQAAAGLLRHRRRAGFGHAHGHVCVDLRCAERLASGVRRQAGQGHRNSGVSSEALGYARDLYASGVFHPDSLNMPSNVIARQRLHRRASSPSTAIRSTAGRMPGDRRLPDAAIRRPADAAFAARDGGKPQHFVTGGHLWATALKKGTPERTKELLRIMNWLAAPFGSEEDQLLTFGLHDIDYTPGREGQSDAHAAGQRRRQLRAVEIHLPASVRVLLAGPAGLRQGDVRHRAHADAVRGVRSDVWPGLGDGLLKRLHADAEANEGVVDIVVGRRPLSDFDQVIKDWQDNGGELVRKEYAESIAAAAS